MKKISKNETKELVDKNAILDKEAVEEYAYVNTAGDAKNYFPEILDEDSAIVKGKKKRTISFDPIKKENDVQESLKNEKDTEIVEEDNRAVDEYKERVFEKESVSDKEFQIEKKA